MLDSGIIVSALVETDVPVEEAWRIADEVLVRRYQAATI